MKFEEWMKATGLSESSINKYVGAIDGPLTSWALSHNFISVPIREVLNPAVFASLAVKIASTPEYEVRNKRGHHMYGAALKKYAEFLAGVAPIMKAGKYTQGPHSQTITVLEATEDLKPYMPEGQEDAREKMLREVVRRRGQPQFRSKLIESYESKCAITGCAVLAILEAAHITPYLGPATNMPSNGILLRADIHTLWDLGLMAIDPEKKTVWVSPKVADETYQKLGGLTVFQPKQVGRQASLAALKQQWELAQKA